MQPEDLIPGRAYRTRFGIAEYVGMLHEFGYPEFVFRGACLPPKKSYTAVQLADLFPPALDPAAALGRRKRVEDKVIAGNLEQLMDFIDAAADRWAAEADTTSMIKNTVSPMRLNRSAPDTVREEFTARMEQNIDAIVRLAFLEGFLLGDENRANVARIKAAASGPATEPPLVDALKAALNDALIWHESEDKALSKQPPSSGPSGNQWRRLQHQEQASNLRAALAGSGAAAKPGSDAEPA